MANQAYDAKFNEMQKYLPFLQKVIEKLKISNDQKADNPRKAQLQKMETLRDLLTNRDKKLKMETLLKCEGVLIKLHTKIEKTPFLQSDTDTSKSNQQITNKVPNEQIEVVDITGPASPPPQQLEEVQQPVEIPTERRCSPIIVNERIKHGQKHKNDRRNQSHDRSRSRWDNNTKATALNSAKSATSKPHQGAWQAGSSSAPIVPRREQIEAYSPEESWNEIVKQPTSTTEKNIPVIELLDDLPMPPHLPVLDKVIHDTIFNFKREDSTVKRNVFERLGGKLSDERTDIKVPNKLTPTKSAPISIPAKTPTIPDVLKSPPLTASDISNLLNESGVSDSNNSTSIAAIGTRRPPKMEPSTLASNSQSSLDIVRKKLAQISKNSTKFEDSPASPISSPISTAMASPRDLNSNERIALKYHPHPRTERSFNSSMDCYGSPIYTNMQTIGPSYINALPAANVNVLPSINPHDPRLRKTSTNIPSLLTMPLIPPTQLIPTVSIPFQSRSTDLNTFSSRNDPRIIRGTPRPPEFACNRSDPRVRPSHAPLNKINNDRHQYKRPGTVGPAKGVPYEFTSHTQSMNARPAARIALSNDSPEENWDSEPESSSQSVENTHNFAAVDKISTRKKNNCVNSTHASNTYSSEENWDSEPETPTAPKSGPQCDLQKTWNSKQVNTYSKHFENADKGPSTFSKSVDSFSKESFPKTYCSDKNVAGQTQTSNRGFVGGRVYPNNAAKVDSPTPTNTRFNALQNDKSERIKYFESKKQKPTVPRTYAEFKQAKARAAAEQAAKKAADSKSVNKVKESTAKEDISIKSTKNDDPTDISTSSKPAVDSTLDKLYRSSDFSASNFPKTKTSFKIPKKQVFPQEEKCTVKVKSDTVTDKTDKAIISLETKEKFEKVDKMGKADLDQQSVSRLNISENSEEQKKAKLSIDKNKKILKKPKVTQNKQGSRKKSEDSKNEKFFENKSKKIDRKDMGIDLNDNSKLKVASEVVTTSSVISKMDDLQPVENIVDTSEKFENVESQSENKTKNLADISEKPKNIEPKSFNTNKIFDSNDLSKESFNKDLPNFAPARILRRRCTMIAFGSAPEVDKEKIFSANSLHFEDVQERNKKRKQQEEEEKQTVRRSKHLADIFQKTDDNCTVSTQNIISGKRRTRTTVNFNEVQQTLAVFKHKKPTETKKKECAKEMQKPKVVPAKKSIGTNKTSPTTKKGATAATKAAILAGAMKTTTDDSKESKSHDDENQNCAVSSTTSQLEDGKENLLTNTNQTSEDVADNEPSSSAKSTTATPTPLEEDNGRQELLEGFVQDILKPNANTEYIFSLLRQILSKEKLELVRAIIESAAKENAKRKSENEIDDHVEDDEVEVTVDDQTEPKELEMENEKESVQPKPPLKKRNKKRNELDRLNDDIRDMFISQGVLTATGRRMCTLVAAVATVNKEKNTEGTKESGNEETLDNAKNTMEKHETQKASTSPRIRKAKVVISPLKTNLLRRSTRSTKVSENTSIADSETQIDNLQENLEDLFEEKSATVETASRLMPVLTPNTPINLPEEQENEIVVIGKINSNIEEKKPSTITPIGKKRKVEVKLAKTKPCPKSKKINHKVASKTLDSVESDSEDNIELSSLQKRFKSNNDEELQAEHKEVVKNTNSNWHSLSKYTKWCVVCNTRISFPAIHYRMNHTEHYASRLAPTVLQQLKQGKWSKPLFGFNMRKCKTLWFYRCPFCLQHNRSILQSWLEHFITHTGEYSFECSKCHKVGNKVKPITQHIAQNCPDGKLIRSNVFNWSKNQVVIKAHVCHLCNFLQLSRTNLEKHYTQQHGCNEDEIRVLGYSINLINLEGVQLVNSKKAGELESAATQKYANEAIIIDDDDESDKEKGEEERSELNQELKEQTKETRCVKSPEGSNALLASSENGFLCQSKKVCHIDKLENEPQKELKENTETAEKCNKETALNYIRATTQSKVVSNSNVFMPTRDTSDSPTADSFAQSLLTIEQETQSSANKKSNATNNVSIAERLTQRFKGLQGKVSSAADTFENVKTAAAMPAKIVESPENKEVEANDKNIPASSKDLVVNNENVMTLPDENVKSSKLPSVEIDANHDTEANTDDENWEDIEILESAPSTSSSIISSTSNKDSKGKNRNIFQKFSRLYASIAPNTKSSNKSKKNATSQCNKKKPTNEMDKSVPNEAVAEKSSNIVISETTTGFRSMITNLADLLPDSPCNDPIDLVPELAPLEPLQDLSDISSILDSNFSALDQQSLMQHMDMETANSVCINTDNQQTSIEEALDFVTEQQDQFDSLTLQTIVVKDRNSPQSSIPLQTSQVVINRIQNIGYLASNDRNSFKFYCMSEHCTFLYSSEAVGLENHYLSEHPQTKWNGYCNSCNARVEDSESLPLSREIKHMLEKHTEARAANKNTESVTTTIDDDERPRIKIRRLSGDILSTTPTLTSNEADEQLDADAYDSSAVFDVNTNLSDLLNARPRPPTKKMPPQVDMPLTEPLFAKENIARNESVPLFKNISKDLTITSVSSVAELLPENSLAPVERPASPLQFQITNVVSLNDAATEQPLKDTTAQLPKIANVCSITRGRTVSETGALWAQHIENERFELEKSAAESLEVTRILTNARHCTVKTPLLRPASDSPEPMVTAETVPVGQATSGDFLITQTISAQYGEGNSSAELGINISIATTTTNQSVNQTPSLTTYSSNSNSGSNSPTTAQHADQQGVKAYAQFKCMGNGCKYRTRVTVAMSEHLQFHERRNFSTQRDYLRCSYCAQLTDDVDGYIKHVEEEHLRSKQAAAVPSTTCAITQKIQNILKDAKNTPEIPEKTHRQKLEETIKDIVTPTGIADEKLYRCVVDGCKTSLTESTFHTHIVYHLNTLGQSNVNNYTYKCPHCTAVYHRPNGIKAHMKSHARHNYFCYLCMETAANGGQILKHFSEKHWRTMNMHTAKLLVPPAADAQNYLVAYAQKLSAQEVQQFGEKLILDWQRKKAGSKTHFKRSEIALLPTQPIFQMEMYCAECLYKTKVRTNLVRHLQMHKDTAGSSGAQQVASVDPVNPVPCLNTNERHFDKMTNLASSSLVPNSSAGAGSLAAGGTKQAYKLKYTYIPETKRFTCGISSCQYLSISDDIFRSHLNALHNGILSYSCPFCKEEICKRGLSSERIGQHLRYHAQKLYQCEECDYLHYMKNVVERHINEKHAMLRVNLISYERAVEDATEGTRTTQVITGKKFKATNTTTAELALLPAAAATTMRASEAETHTKSKYKWACDLCEHKAISQPQIVTHCNAQHGCKQQYQCVHCSFGAAQLQQIMSHIDEKHSGKAREARYIYHKLVQQNDAAEDAADTRPLWQRDDPKRVRHIRGILMENEEESERHQKRLRLDDDDVDSVKSLTASPSLYLDLYEFACFYCECKTPHLNKLRQVHWQRKHNCKVDWNKPFLCRLLKQHRCALCQKFRGSYAHLQAHLQNVHKTRNYRAADACVPVNSEQIVCAYCDFACARSDELYRHHQQQEHMPPDIKHLSEDHLAGILRLGVKETYVQCTLCGELFGNRSAIVTHARDQHLNATESFSFKEFFNQIIYQCAVCQLTATDELTVMRHMIEHYGPFKRCHFCDAQQNTFNSYMQHCYTEHRTEIKRFIEIYKFTEIKRYLMQIFVIFPNGLIVNKRSLRYTAHGNDQAIQQLYEEICKTSQEPPIPRLSIARLVARKSVEAKQTNADDQMQRLSASTAEAIQLANDSIKQPAALSLAKKISKRRFTVAWGNDENQAKAFGIANAISTATPSFLTPAKKQKLSNSTINTNTSATPIPVQSAAVVADLQEAPVELAPYSFYGKTPAPVDLSKIYTKVAIAGLDTPLSIEKFKMLFPIDPRVVAEKLHAAEISESGSCSTSATATVADYNEYSHVKKACPASHKHKYA